MMPLKHEKRYRVQIADGETVEVVLVGCGGTGSFLALHLARLAYHLRERYGRRLELTLVDFDRVEEKNVGRQNFCPMEVGEPKAAALMRRLNTAFGLEFKAITAPLEMGMFANAGARFRLLIGAVDGAGGRRELDRCARNHQGLSWWLDCGNHEHSGQVLLGNRGDIEEPSISLGTCFALPLPSVQHPELLEDDGRGAGAIVESCAELAVRDAQSLMINQMMAGWAASYVYRLLIGRDLEIYATYVDLVSGSARSVGICERKSAD